MEKFHSAWKKFRTTVQLKESHKNKLTQLKEDRKVLNEVSREAAEKIYDWMRDASVMDYSFDRLFDGKMRLAMPFDTEDALNLKKVVRTLRKDGWMAGEAPQSPEHQAVPQPTLGHGKFPTRKVKQKRQRLADQGGGFYEEEIEVADLGLAKSYEKEIPAGPRKGEVIQRTDKLGMGKAIAKLVKEKKLDNELLDWWHQRQTYYTKDNNWREIEGLFSGEEVDYTVIISRHPIDVLRMSDVGNISSCHSEGASHWHCAKAEAKGHGPIAYLVPTSDYEKLVAGLYDEGLAADQTPAVMKNIDKVARREAQDYIERYFLKFNPRWGTIYRHRDNPEQVEFAIKAVEDEWSVKKAYEDLPTPAKAFLSDQVILDAVIAKAEKKDQPLTKQPEQEKEPKEPEELPDISEFDDKEIFRDRNRGIKGVVANGRVRFRKFEDGETGLQFTAPEHRTYGAVPPGFVNSMIKWAAESQEGALKDRGFLGDEEFAPDWYNITRYGGSYEDTTDGEVLGDLFKHFDPEFGAYDGEGNVNNESDEEEDQAQEMWDEYEGRIDELNNQAANHLEHVSCHASLEEGGGMDGNQPIIYASADLEVELKLDGWVGLDADSGDHYYQPINNEFEGQPGTEITMIPHSYNPSDYAARNSFESELESPLDHYSEETEWEVDEMLEGGKRKEGDVVLTVRFRFSCEDCNDPDDYENFVDYMSDDIDKKYEEIKEKIRLALVEEEYIARNYFDNMLYPAGWDEEREEPSESPVEMFAGDLKHFEYTAPDKDGEMTFKTSQRASTGLTSYISSEMIFPADLYANSPTFRDLQAVFGGDRHPHVYQTGVKHTGHGKQEIAQALSDLEVEAREEGERQLAFEFGDQYKKEYSAILPDFAKDTEMYTVIKTNPEGSHLAFGVQIIARSVDSEREIKGALAFVKHIDDNIDRVRKAFERLWAPAIEEAVERKEKAEALAVSRGTADQLLKALDTYSMSFDDVPESDPRFNPRAAAAKALITWTEESWDQMTKLERRTLIAKFLRPVQQAYTSEVKPDRDSLSNTPMGWNQAIQNALREAGAGWTVINAYKWEGPDYGAIYSALTNPEGVDPKYQPPEEAVPERYLTQAVRQGAPTAARGGVRQGTPITATMGEPVPAGQIRHPAYGLPPAQDMEINEPPEDIREAIRNAIRETIYKQEPQKVSKNSNLKEVIRKAFEESLYSQGGPEDLPGMGPGLAKRDDDPEPADEEPVRNTRMPNSKLKESIRKACYKTLLREQVEDADWGEEGVDWEWDTPIEPESYEDSSIVFQPNLGYEDFGAELPEAADAPPWQPWIEENDIPFDSYDATAYADYMSRFGGETAQHYMSPDDPRYGKFHTGAYQPSTLSPASPLYTDPEQLAQRVALGVLEPGDDWVDGSPPEYEPQGVTWTEQEQNHMVALSRLTDDQARTLGLSGTPAERLHDYQRTRYWEKLSDPTIFQDPYHRQNYLNFVRAGQTAGQATAEEKAFGGTPEGDYPDTRMEDYWRRTGDTGQFGEDGRDMMGAYNEVTGFAMWGDTGDFSRKGNYEGAARQSKANDRAWSAGFISAMQNDPEFARGEGHHAYMMHARETRRRGARAGEHTAYRPSEIGGQFRPGDLICVNRAGSNNDAFNHHGAGKHHCDIVTSINAETGDVETIGGNVTDTTGITKYNIYGQPTRDGRTSTGRKRKDGAPKHGWENAMVIRRAAQNEDPLEDPAYARIWSSKDGRTARKIGAALERRDQDSPLAYLSDLPLPERSLRLRTPETPGGRLYPAPTAMQESQRRSLKDSIRTALQSALLREQRETTVPGMEEIAIDNFSFQPSEARLEPAAQMGMQYDDPTPQEEAYLDFRKHYAKTPMYDPESGVAYQQRDWLDMGQLPGEPGWVPNTMPEDDRGRGPRRTMPTRGTPDEYLANLTAEDAAMDPRYDRWMQQAGLRPGDPGFDADNLYGPEEEIPENIYSAPVSNRGITSAGWTTRASPGTDESTGLPIPGRFHAGTDVGGRSGESIYSTLPGRVLSSEYRGGYGWTVTLQHVDPRTGTPMATRDAHFLEKPDLKPGDWVEGGAQIGRMGSTGMSTGTHLHHEEYGLGGRLANAENQAQAERAVRDERARLVKMKEQGVPYYPAPGMIGPGYGAERSWPTEWGLPARGDEADYTELVGRDEPIEPGNYPELIKPAPFVDQRASLRETNSSALENAIREAIKIKVSEKPEGCETCGDIHGAEEACELPTLEEAYIQNVYEATCSLNIHKQRGGNRDQTLTDIRGILGVTIVSVIPGTTRDLPHAFITGLSIKFEINRNLPPRNYIKGTLLPGMSKIPGVSNFQVKTVEQVTAAEGEI